MYNLYKVKSQQKNIQFSFFEWNIVFGTIKKLTKKREVNKVFLFNFFISSSPQYYLNFKVIEFRYL